MSDQTIRYVGPRQIVIDGHPTPVPFWTPERVFDGLPVAIIGGGPSLAELDLAQLRGHPFIAVNSSCRKVRPIATSTDILFFHDNSWNENRPQLAQDWPGLVVTSNRNAKARLGDKVCRLDMSLVAERIGALPDHVGASSGHTATCLAAMLGADPIVLIGFEGQAVAGRTHGHDDYWQHDLAAFQERFLPGWAGLAPAFARHGVRIINATPHSAVTEFPVMEFAAALGIDA